VFLVSMRITTREYLALKDKVAKLEIALKKALEKPKE